MLRTIFVAAIVLLGCYLSFHGPFYLLLFYLWNAYFRPEQWMWSDWISPLRLSLALGIGLALATLFNIRRARWDIRLWLVGLFFCQSVVSLFASEHFDWSWNYWVDFAKVLLVAVAIPVLVLDLGKFRLTILTIGYSLGLEAAKQGWAQFFLNPGMQNSNPHPALGDNNGVGMGMMMLVPLFVALARTSLTRWERYTHWFFIVGLFYRGISTYSRGAFLAAAVLGVVGFIRSRQKVRALLVATVLAVAVISVMPEKFWDRMQTISASADEQDASQRGRIFFWQTALRMAAAKPFTGIGFNGFRPSFPSYDVSGGAWGDDRAVHSAWFGVAAEMGYPGLVLFSALLLLTILACRRLIRKPPALDDANHLIVRSYAIALQTSLVVYAAGVTFLNGQYNEMFWHLIGLTLALEWITARILSDPAVSTRDSQARRPLNPAMSNLSSR